MNTTLTAADGHNFNCWMHPAEGPAKGGLVILQEIFGVTEQLKGVAHRYAALGLNVAIPALFDRQSRDAIFSFDQGAGGREMMLAAKLDETMMDIDCAVKALELKGGKVAVMGFCWGGGLAVRAAQALNVNCGVAFYGTRLDQYLDKPLNVPVMGHFGTRDDHVPGAILDAAKTAWPTLEIHMYDAGHAFANEAREGSYSPEDAAVAHERTAAFLNKHLG